MYLYIINGYSSTFWWSHFKINNISLYMYSILILFNNYCIYIADKHIKMGNNYLIDYVFSLMNVSIYIPIIFISNSLFVFFFVLELISCTIFYKFIVSKIQNNSDKNKFYSIFYKNYTNLLFYQY